MYNQPDCGKPLRKDRARQALTQRGRCSEHIHSGKARASAEKDPGFAKQHLPHVRRQKSGPVAVLHSSLAVPWQRHSWRVWQPTVALALPPLSGIQPSPVAIPLHDERLSNPTITNLRVVSTQHKGFSSISAPTGL